MKKEAYAVSLLLSVSIVSVSYADDPRFSRVLEFEVMSGCIGNTTHKKRKIEICACTLAKTQENGIWPDYDNDDDVKDNIKKFLQEFKNNAEYYGKNPGECKRI